MPYWIRNYEYNCFCSFNSVAYNSVPAKLALVDTSTKDLLFLYNIKVHVDDTFYRFLIAYRHLGTSTKSVPLKANEPSIFANTEQNNFLQSTTTHHNPTLTLPSYPTNTSHFFLFCLWRQGPHSSFAVPHPFLRPSIDATLISWKTTPRQHTVRPSCRNRK